MRLHHYGIEAINSMNVIHSWATKMTEKEEYVLQYASSIILLILKISPYNNVVGIFQVKFKSNVN